MKRSLVGRRVYLYGIYVIRLEIFVAEVIRIALHLSNTIITSPRHALDVIGKVTCRDYYSTRVRLGNV